MSSMKDSERLTAKGCAVLRNAGWPPDAIKQVATIFLEAGFNQCLETQEEMRERDKGVISRAIQ